jgi:ligand-binding sensor domain-containing protein
LPVRTFTTADGLPRDLVTCLVSDSRGFLWLCTAEGLARFDGYQFRTYGVDQGLPSPAINTVLETRSGQLLIGTEAGLAALKPHADESNHSRFEVYAPGPRREDRWIQKLMEDHHGQLWCAAGGGLFRVSWIGASPRFETVAASTVVDLAEDQHGNVWAAVRDEGLLEILTTGEILRYGKKQGLPSSRVYAVAVDGEGSIWAGTHSGLCKLRPRPAADGRIVEHVYTKEISNSGFRVNCLYVSRSGRLWVGGSGASEWIDNGKQPFLHWGAAEGITDRSVHAIGEDGAGNLWMATGDLGAKRIAQHGLVTFTRADGLAHNTENASVNAFTETHNGDFFAITLFDSLALNRLDGDRFEAIHPACPDHIRWIGWGWGSIGFEDHGGDWWLATGEGLCRFDGSGGARALARRSPKALYTTKDGLAANEIFRIFEDKRGDIWVATNGPVSVSRWDRATRAFQQPPILVDNSLTVTAFAEDRAGNVWVGTTEKIFRWRAGRLERIDRPGDLPQSAAALFLTTRGVFGLVAGRACSVAMMRSRSHRNSRRYWGRQ